MRFTTQDAAHMSDSVYKAEVGDDVHWCGPPPIRGYAPQRWVHESGSGFTGAIYTPPGRAHVVLAFAGTHPRLWPPSRELGKDLAADIQIAMNDVPIGQMECAHRLYMAAKDASAGQEIIAVGLQVLDVARRSAQMVMGLPRMDDTWARHLGRVVHLGRGSGVHSMNSMIEYIDRQPWALREPWDVRSV